MMGASAHACSVLRPNLPFLKAMSVKDLSNHLQERCAVTGLVGQGSPRGWGHWATPVVTVAVQQGLAIEAEAGLLLGVVLMRFLVQSHKKGSALDGVQGCPVLA